jgi:hypothetical protein
VKDKGRFGRRRVKKKEQHQLRWSGKEEVPLPSFV